MHYENDKRFICYKRYVNVPKVYSIISPYFINISEYIIIYYNT